MARREAVRNKGRSLMVVAMLALPVAGASAADTLWRSSQVTVAEQAVRDMGHYDALLTTESGTPLYQNADGSRFGPAATGQSSTGGSTGGSTGTSTADPTSTAGPTPTDLPKATAADLAALLPPGARIAGPMERDLQVVVADATGRRFATLREVDLADPLTDGIARHRAGTAPTADDQIAISRTLADHLGKGVGDSVDVRVATYGPATAASNNGPSTKTLRITGIYDGNDDLYGDQLFARHGTFQGGPQVSADVYYVALPGGVDWSQVQKLNQRGFTVESKKVLADPPPRSQMPYYTTVGKDIGHGASASTVALIVIALAMVLLEVVLLAGPAFAVSARRRRRDFGLLGAAGADGRRLRRIVLADGVVLGLAGGVAGTVAGVAGGAVTLPLFAHLSRQNPGGFRIMPGELLGAAAVGVVTGLAAALAPALVTARQDVLAALTGRRGQVRTPWKMSMTGLVMVGVGTALLLVGALSGASPWPVAAGIALSELGVVACTPLLVSWFGRLGRVLPLTGRLAVRDGARNRGRTAPAVAAIMAAVAGASAVAMIVTSIDAQSRHDYVSDLHPGQAAVTLGVGLGESPEQLAGQLAAALPTSEYAIIDGVADPNAPTLAQQATKASPQGRTSRTPLEIPRVERPAANICPQIAWGLSGAALDAALQRQAGDPRCRRRHGFESPHFGESLGTVVSGGPEVARAVLGRSDPAAESVLKAGGIVVFTPLDLTTTGAAPTARVGADAVCVRGSGDGTTVELDGGAQGKRGIVGPADCPAANHAPLTLPAVAVDAPNATVDAIVAPGVLDRLGVAFSPQAIVFNTTRMPTDAEQKKADDVAAAAGVDSSFYVERGYQNQTWIGLLALAGVAGVVMLGAAAVATGLAITDAQNDLETLAAVGARPRVRRALAGSQAATTAGLGALLGALFGLLPAVGILEVKHTLRKQVAFGAPAGSPQLVVPWLFLVLVIVALPTVAAFGAAGMTRSRITIRRRRE